MPETERRNQISTTPAPDLPVDVVADILSRLPVKSLCHFKCVSRRWHALCSDPRRGRRNLPRTLSGFFYQSVSRERFPARHFAGGIPADHGRRAPPFDPAFSFLPGAERTSLVDCCDGLLLCRRWEGALTDSCGFVVLNPAVERWVALPESAAPAHGARTVCLAFDPAVSSHFHVLAFLEDERYYVTGVEIYSSETGHWSRHESGWSGQTTLRDDAKGVFFNGMLHLVVMEAAIVAVDVHGKTWRTMAVPRAANYRPMITGAGHGGFIGMDDGSHIGVSQGNLCYLQPDGLWTLSIWVLEDYGTEEWILKHNVTTSLLLADSLCWRSGWDCRVIAVHPDGNSIFFVAGSEKTLGSYELVTKEVSIIRNLGHDCENLYLTYVPFFSESLGDGSGTATYDP